MAASNFDYEASRPDGALKKQLSRISRARGKMVPLHGRLFEQGPHYAFQRGCSILTGRARLRRPRHYTVCCFNDCEACLTVVEDAVSAPVVPPVQIISDWQMNNVDDEVPKLDGTLKRRLTRIFRAHGGKAPLHSRPSAKWPRYVFRRRCSYPHRSGAHSPVSPYRMYCFNDGEADLADAEMLSALPWVLLFRSSS